jgi:hypothetical protein
MSSDSNAGRTAAATGAASTLNEYVERECLRLYDARGPAWTNYATPDRPGNHVIEGYLLKVCGEIEHVKATIAI